MDFIVVVVVTYIEESGVISNRCILKTVGVAVSKEVANHTAMRLQSLGRNSTIYDKQTLVRDVDN